MEMREPKGCRYRNESFTPEDVPHDDLDSVEESVLEDLGTKRQAVIFVLPLLFPYCQGRRSLPVDLCFPESKGSRWYSRQKDRGPDFLEDEDEDKGLHPPVPVQSTYSMGQGELSSGTKFSLQQCCSRTPFS